MWTRQLEHENGSTFPFEVLMLRIVVITSQAPLPLLAPRRAAARCQIPPTNVMALSTRPGSYAHSVGIWGVSPNRLAYFPLVRSEASYIALLELHLLIVTHIFQHILAVKLKLLANVVTQL